MTLIRAWQWQRPLKTTYVAQPQGHTVGLRVEIGLHDVVFPDLLSVNKPRVMFGRADSRGNWP